MAQQAQQPRSSRRTLQALVALIVILILILLGVFVFGDDDNGDDDDGDSEEARAGQPVAILVVDDFGDHIAELTASIDEASFKAAADFLREIDPQGEEYEQQIQAALENLFAENRENVDAQVSERLEGNIAEDNCYAIPEGQGFFNAGGAGFFNAGGAGFFNAGGAGLPVRPAHGERVFAQLQELVSKHAGDANIDLRQVDTQGFSTEVIAQRIEDEIAAVLEKEPDSNIVINMSFAVIPCTDLSSIVMYERLMREFNPEETEDLARLQQLFQDLLAGNLYRSPLQGNDALTGKVNELCPPDDTAERGCQLRGDTENLIVIVGAAGNGAEGAVAGSDFPFLPAAFGEVVSVSASADEVDFVASPPRDTYSNAGAVLMPGRWTHPDGFLELGTSFAAPRYSFLVAMELAGESLDVCGTGAAIEPPVPDDWTGGSAVTPSDVPVCP